MKQLISSVGSSLLSREQMKQILGGVDGISGNACSACSESSCNGGCTTLNGNQGSCGWTAVPEGHCTCGSGGL